MRRGLPALPLLCLWLSACGGGKTIKVDGAEQSVADVVSSQTKFHPTDVTCPSGVDAVVGKTFDCHFTGPDALYVAHVRIVAVQGDNARFFVRTKPIAPLPKSGAQ